MTPRTLIGVPLVTLQVPLDRHGAMWAGKWHLNLSVDAVKAMGGPWDTEQAACDAVLATGHWVARGDRPGHFVRVTQ